MATKGKHESNKPPNERTPMHLANRKSEIVDGSWLPDMDLNHDKQIQSLLCYRYTIGQAGACGSVNLSRGQSSRQTGVPAGRKTIAHGFNRGSTSEKNHKPRRGGRNPAKMFCRPFGTRFPSESCPRLKPWAIFCRASGACSRITHHASRS